VGELLRELEARGVRDHTLIPHVSDNGWEIGQGCGAVARPGRHAVDADVPAGFQAKRIVVSLRGDSRRARDLIVSQPHRIDRRDRRAAKRERHAAHH